VDATWRAEARGGRPYVVFTGGEPTLQLDAALVEACHARGFEVALETNGTRPLPPGVDWVCVSPKPRSELVVRGGDELKLVHPQDELPPSMFEDLSFDHFFLQPMDGPSREANTAAAVAWCRRNPRWRLSLQTHKLLGIP
jgi:organic radical activating enzyme